MATIETIRTVTQGLTLNDRFDPTEEVQLHDKFGFWHFPDRSSSRRLSLLAFMAPYLARQEGEPYPFPCLNDADTVKPVTTFSALADSMQTGENTTKGVGSRACSTAEVAVTGSDVANWPRFVGAYILEISPDGILDWREKQGGLVRQIGHQVVQRVTGMLKNPEYVADAMHAQYGTAEAVVIKRPVKGTYDHYMRGFTDPRGIDPVIAVLRNPDLELERVAHTYNYQPNGGG